MRQYQLHPIEIRLKLVSLSEILSIFLVSLTLVMTPAFGAEDITSEFAGDIEAFTDLSSQLDTYLTTETNTCMFGYQEGTQYVDALLLENGQANFESTRSYLRQACGGYELTSKIFERITEIARCMQVSRAAIFAIWIEETRCSRVSDTGGGVGPLQFTPLGMTEVNDQLGARGRAQAQQHAIDYFAGSGGQPGAFACAGGRQFSSHRQFHGQLYNSAVYAAVLLKVHMSRAIHFGCATPEYQRNHETVEFRRAVSPSRREGCWRSAFYYYNGNDAKRRGHNKSIQAEYQHNAFHYMSQLLGNPAVYTHPPCPHGEPWRDADHPRCRSWSPANIRAR